jgi:periplasmic protein TonB
LLYKTPDMYFTAGILSLSLTCISLFGFSQKQDTVIVTTSPVVVSDSRVFTKVEKHAEFPGGAEGWRTYLMQNLRYPNKALKKNIQGVVRVEFLVDHDGNISEVKGLNDPGGGLMEEAVRIIKYGPKWQPAEQDGRKVLYRQIQAITFALE